jgi:hypothetical protein
MDFIRSRNGIERLRKKATDSNLVPRVCLFAGYVKHYITREQAYSGNEIALTEV